MPTIHTMSEKGDVLLEWDLKDVDSVYNAKKKFKEMRKKGFLIFKVGKVFKRKTKQKALKFDPDVNGYMIEGIDDIEEGDKAIAIPPIAGGTMAMYTWSEIQALSILYGKHSLECPHRAGNEIIRLAEQIKSERAVIGMEGL